MFTPGSSLIADMALRDQEERRSTMTLANLFQRKRDRKPARIRVADEATGWSPRDWADLPVHHPRQAD
jgi:hypothetical protein